MRIVLVKKATPGARLYEPFALAGAGSVTSGPKATIEGGELRAFLVSLDEYGQEFHRVERRLRDSRSTSTVACPMISDKLPAANRRRLSICHNLSCAVTYPCAMSASS